MDKVKKIGKIIISSMIVLLVCFCLYIGLVINILHKDYVNIFGYTYFVVASGSMQDTIDVDDIIIVKVSKDIKVNDIVTYKDEDNKMITHRVVEIDKDKIITKGDANNVADSPISKNQIIGKVVSVKSPVSFFKIFAVLIVLYLLYLFIDTNKTFIKFALKDGENVPKDLFKSNTEISTGNTITIPLDEIERMNKNYDKNKAEDLDEYVDYENIEDVINNILSILRLKNKDKERIKINKEWLIKYKYVYELTLLLKYKDIDKFMHKLYNPTFEELFDYDLDDIGLNENIKNQIYTMPLYVILRLLLYCILCNDRELFDAIYKMLKYRVNKNKDGVFKSIKKNDNNTMIEINSLLLFMKKVPSKYDKKQVFELDKIGCD